MAKKISVIDEARGTFDRQVASMQLGGTNVHAHTKALCEQILVNIFAEQTSSRNDHSLDSYREQILKKPGGSVLLAPFSDAYEAGFKALEKG